MRHLIPCVVVMALARIAAGAAATAPLSPQEKLDSDPRLAGWWKFDEASGTTAADSSPRGRAGSLKGDLTFEKGSAEGRIGKALQLDGKAQFVEIPGHKGVTGTKPRTIAAWVKTSKDRGEVMSWGADEPGKMWIFRIVPSGIHVEPRGGYLYTDSRVHDDRWHHVAAVIEPADCPNLHDNVKLYKDGELQEIHDIGLCDLYTIDTGDALDLRIGRGFAGLLDDVRLYERALTPPEIAILAQKAPKNPPKR